MGDAQGVHVPMDLNQDSNNSKQPDGEPLLSGRLVLDGVEGDTVYIRTLRYGEVDNGQGVQVPAGYKVAMRAGALVVNVNQIDDLSQSGLGGYAPVANTVWTWYQFGQHPENFLHFMFSFARRLDTGHALWASAIEERDRAKELPGIEARVGFISALATAEVAVVALHRAIRMAHSLVKKYRPDLDVPESADSVLEPLKEIRDAFEHIDERAESRSGQRGKFDPDALTIFDQPAFFSSGILTYKEVELDFDCDVLSALLDCRGLVMEAMSNSPPDHQ